MSKKRLNDVGEGMDALRSVEVNEPAPVELEGGDVNAMFQRLLEQGETVQKKADSVRKTIGQQLAVIRQLNTAKQAVRDLPATKEMLARAEDYVKFQLASKDLTVRRAANMGLFEFCLTGLTSVGAVETALAELVDRGVLAKSNTDAGVEIDHIRYVVNLHNAEDSSTDTGIEPKSQEETEVLHRLQQVAEFVRNAEQAARRAQWAEEREEATKWPGQATLTVSQLIKQGCPDGNICFGVYEPGRIRGDREFKPLIGTLLAEKKDRLLYPVLGSSHMRQVVQRAREARDGRGIGVNMDDLLDGLAEHDQTPRLRMPRDMEEMDITALIHAYWAFHWGIVSTQLNDLRLEMAKQANVDMEAALLKRANGIVLISIFGWRNDKADGWLESETLYPRRVQPDGLKQPAIWFLAEFFQENDQAPRKFRVLQVPEIVEGLLASHVDQWHPDEFGRMPEPLNRLMSAAYGEAVETSKRNAKKAAAQGTNGSSADDAPVVGNGQ